ncbi:hypothetical protein [Rhodococcus tukisamuensis]|uniref:Uncharacterized protein n=1 Tax=Rhodococcus tukisamuensis TaxID=168276 RepID=A0A1G6UTI3_9NOCA|nr:hypothetical protein [Rhodococcus tukisamuensis]SDD43855.1 hypothetical protein SAMN05444580_104274 [Rhodococcus tukisamuensis]
MADVDAVSCGSLTGLVGAAVEVVEVGCVLGSAAAIAVTGTAAAGDLPTDELPADVTIRVDGNTIRATMSVHGTPGPLGAPGTNSCRGPWVHTEASANRIRTSPDIDLEANRASWLMYQPDSPSGAMTGNPATVARILYLDAGQSGEAVIPAVADGKYVAGFVCGQYEAANGYMLPKYTSLKLYPLTVGTPEGTPNPEAGGSLAGLGFGSS